jgi:hypothetical protein
MALMASNGILIDVNAAFSQRLHMPADMLIQQPLTPYLHPADVEIYQQGLAQLRTVGKPHCQLVPTPGGRRRSSAEVPSQFDLVVNP